MKIVDMVLAALLVVAALLQLNDPDPAYWILVYGLGALVPLLNALGKPQQFIAALSIGMAISGMIYAAPGVSAWLQAGDFGAISGSMDGPATYVEPAREFIGLLMQLLVVSYYAWRWRAV